MGWTILYIAFGIVALWLLGEVLLQYKARLRWRVLAFVGFLCVVLGVVRGSVVIIAVGAIAFAAGQTYVTLSFRRGFTTGWALGGGPGQSRRRKSDPGSRRPAEPELEYDTGYDQGYADQGYESAYGDQPYGDAPYEDPGHDDPNHDEQGYGGQGYDGAGYGDEAGDHALAGSGGGYDPYASYEPAGQEAPAPTQAVPVYEPEPLPEETGGYGIYGTEPAPAYGSSDYAADAAPTGAAGYGYPAADPYATTAAAGYGSPGEYGYDAYGGYAPYGGAQEHAYAEPVDQPIGYDWQGYGGQGYDQQAYGYETQQPGSGYPADPYADNGYAAAPADGAWMPQQRSADAPEGDSYAYYQDQVSGGYDPTAYDPTAYDPTSYDPSAYGGPSPYGNGYDDPQYRY